MSAIDRFLVNNAEYAETFRSGDLNSPPEKHTAVVACMDARMDVYALLGLVPGDAHVIRNAGGVVTDDVIRSLIISQRLLGTREIMLVHHTRCGMLSFSGRELRETIREETGIRPPFAMETFTDLEADLKQSIARIQATPFLQHTDDVRGFVYDVDSGRVREIE